MENTGKLVKFLAVIYVLGIVIWLGGSIIRTAIAYDVYVPATELQLKTNYSDTMRVHNVRLFGMGALYTEISYGLAAVAALMLLFMLRKELKLRGWVFISLALFLITFPIELFLMYYDIKINMAIRYDLLTSFSQDVVKDYFINRFTKLNFLAPTAYLCGASAIVFFIWRPLDKTTSVNAPREAE